mgnify:FL=1
MMNLLKKREKRALEWLYEKHSAMVYGTVRQVALTEEATEQLLVQSYINAWKRATTIDVVSDQSLPWLFNIVVDTIVEYAEQHPKHTYTFSMPDLVLGWGFDDLEYAGHLNRLERALEKHFHRRAAGNHPVYPKNDKLQQSVVALRARLKINQQLLPR